MLKLDDAPAITHEHHVKRACVVLILSRDTKFC